MRVATVARLEDLTKGALVGEFLAVRPDHMTTVADPLLAVEDLSDSQSETVVATSGIKVPCRTVVAIHGGQRRQLGT